MPYAVANASVVALVLRGRMEGQDVMNVLHYRLSAGGTINDGRTYLQNFINVVNSPAGLVSRWKNCLSAQVAGMLVTAQWIAPIRYGALTSTTVPGQGSQLGPAMPVNTAGAITRRTERAGRGEVGTIHMPGLIKDWVVNGLLTGAASTAYDDFAAISLQTVSVLAPTAVDFFPILYRRQAPFAPEALSNYAIQPTARVMRRRTVGLGS